MRTEISFHCIQIFSPKLRLFHLFFLGKTYTCLLYTSTAGMDALSRRQMWNLLRQLNGKNLTILLTTHYMEEAQSLCNRVALMDHGKLEEINTPSGLIDGLGKYTVEMCIRDRLRNTLNGIVFPDAAAQEPSSET